MMIGSGKLSNCRREREKYDEQRETGK